ncbi:MAG: hypothetical protein HYZ85_03010 [Candidatus Omnitrophica bacterium]|nr:hypothetical protein [Candidatus Omnitrophota bacterium]
MAESKEAEGKPAPKAPKPEAAAPKPVADKPHHLKITQMSLKQVEEALESVQKHMGGMNSHYARALMARREFLIQGQRVSVSIPLPKAA